MESSTNNSVIEHYLAYFKKEAEYPDLHFYPNVMNLMRTRAQQLLGVSLTYIDIPKVYRDTSVEHRKFWQEEDLPFFVALHVYVDNLLQAKRSDNLISLIRQRFQSVRYIHFFCFFDERLDGVSYNEMSLSVVPSNLKKPVFYTSWKLAKKMTERLRSLRFDIFDIEENLNDSIYACDSENNLKVHVKEEKNKWWDIDSPLFCGSLSVADARAFDQMLFKYYDIQQEKTGLVYDTDLELPTMLSHFAYLESGGSPSPIMSVDLQDRCLLVRYPQVDQLEEITYGYHMDVDSNSPLHVIEKLINSAIKRSKKKENQ